MDGGAWRATVHEVKQSDMPEQLTLLLHFHYGITVHLLRCDDSIVLLQENVLILKNECCLRLRVCRFVRVSRPRSRERFRLHAPGGQPFS